MREEELSAEARQFETGAATAYRADRVHLHEDPLQCACRLDKAEVGTASDDQVPPKRIPYTCVSACVRLRS